MAAHETDDERGPRSRAPGKRRTALLVIDMLNDYRHQDGDALAESARAVVGNIERLIAVARERGEVLVVHVNDNRGLWSADRRALVDRATNAGTAR